jgi:hypothetical protein
LILLAKLYYLAVVGWQILTSISKCLALFSFGKIGDWLGNINKAR